MMTSGSAGRLEVPEIGPLLGHLTDAPSAHRGALGLAFNDLRLALVTSLVELAGAARQFAAAGDRAGALHSLGRIAWVRAWEQAVQEAADRVTAAANAGFEVAAKESRFPVKRLTRITLTADDTQAIAARLGSGAAELFGALEALDRAIATTSAPSASPAAWRMWHDALGAVARRLESAWLALESAAVAEQQRWSDAIARVRAWRRPMWPLGLGAAAVFLLAIYFGLVLGGYIATPALLRGMVDAVWSRGWM